MKFFALIAGFLGSAIFVTAVGSDAKAKCQCPEECTPTKGGCFNLTTGQFVIENGDKISCGCVSRIIYKSPSIAFFILTWIYVLSYRSKVLQ